MNDLLYFLSALLLVNVGNWWLAALISAVFALFGRAVRGVTRSGAATGAVICLALILGAGWGGLGALAAVFLLTWAATRLGYSRKSSLGTAEPRRGRDAWQVLANLGIAATASVLYATLHDARLLVATGAALSEAAADTVSSEVGQALGGTPRLVTNWRAVPAGSNGAITGIGTVTGIAAAIAISAACALGGLLRGGRDFALCTLAAVLGMLFDSFLGATVEGKAGVGNNLVNFFSTLVAAFAAWLLSSR